MLLAWLSDDDDRSKLFARINRGRGAGLVFPSRDSRPREPEGLGYREPRAKAVTGHKDVTLVTDRDRIESILRDRDHYSSRVYAELGGGSFMLALDPTSTAHTQQREAFANCFPASRTQLRELAHAACQNAGVMAFRAPDFDLADFAEQAALRLCQTMMGYAVKDYPLLEGAIRAGYRGLVHQVYGRHFVTDPTVIPGARMAIAGLLTRTSELIDAYADRCELERRRESNRRRRSERQERRLERRVQLGHANANVDANEDEDENGCECKDQNEKRIEDAVRGCDDPSLPSGMKPVLERLATWRNDMNGEQRAFIAVGAAIGTVGNVQAAACIAVKALFADRELLRQACELACEEPTERRTTDARYDRWKRLIAPALRANPPIPYLPRIRIDADGVEEEELLLALGGATSGEAGREADGDDALVWGGPAGEMPHNCAGKELGWPLIIEIVRQVMSLPGLAQSVDPRDGTIEGLEKTRGFACVAYPLTHRRDRWRTQTSLNVAMRIRPPVKDNVDKVREIIRCGAPVIERLLRQCRHVHFAWFELIEADTVLVLHTVYDGPFGAYLQHFALQAGDLFDVLFEFIADPPPIPVRDFPNEFAAHLLRYNRLPAMGYFFSAYPCSEVARIVRNEVRGT